MSISVVFAVVLLCSAASASRLQPSSQLTDYTAMASPLYRLYGDTVPQELQGILSNSATQAAATAPPRAATAPPRAATAPPRATAAPPRAATAAAAPPLAAAPLAAPPLAAAPLAAPPPPLAPPRAATAPPPLAAAGAVQDLDKAQSDLSALAFSLLADNAQQPNTISDLSLDSSNASIDSNLTSTATTIAPPSVCDAIHNARDGSVCGACGLQTYASGLKPNAVEVRVAQVLLEDMLLGRAFEDKIAELYFKGIVSGFVHLYNGQEAVSTGIVKSLRDDDFVVSTYRDHVHALSKGVSAREVLAELSGKVTGCSRGRGGSIHMFSKAKNFVGGFAFIGEQVPIALGLAYSIAYRRTLAGRRSSEEPARHDQVVVVFTGDGSTNIGQFYESLNIAALAKLPLIFVVENNNWAIGMAHYRSTAVPEIAKRGAPFGVPSIEVDGMDVLVVRTAMEKAMTTARSGGGPTLIEALTYRFRGHSVADPDELRAIAEKQALLKRDPITKFVEEYMKPNGYINDYLYKATKLRIRALVEDAVQFTNASQEPCPSTLENYVFAEKYNHPNEDGTDPITEDVMKQYADALKAEIEFTKMNRSQKKAAPPFFASTNPLRVID